MWKIAGYYKKSLRILLVIIIALLTFNFNINSVYSQTYKDCSRVSVGYIPLIQMTADQYYPNNQHSQKINGGLYGNGINNLSNDHSHMIKAWEANASIVPRDSNGNPTTSGKIGFVSIGMSNTSSEFDVFMRTYKNSSLKSPSVVMVNGAQPGRVAARWANETEPWTVLSDRVQAAGLSKKQIQVVWIKLTNMNPRSSDAYPVFASKLRDDMGVIVKKLKQEGYTNVWIVYLSSRIYAGYSLTIQSPEPFAYEGGFSNRWLIEDQINGGGATGVTYTNSPVLLWGPYLWADGTTPNIEGLSWDCSDFTDDGVHPAATGNRKVADYLFNFLTTNPQASSWFSTSPAPTSTPSVTLTPAGPTLTPTITPIPTETPIPSETPTPTQTPTPTETPTLTPTPTPSATLTPTPTGEPTDYVAKWTFDENTGTQAFDASANTNTLTLINGANWITGYKNTALNLDGTNDYASRNDASLVGSFPAKSSNASQHFTISAWVRLDITGRNQPVVTKQGYKARGFDFYVSSGNKVSLEVFNGNFSSTIANSNTSLTANTWYHLTVSYDYVSSSNSVIKLYINGVLDKTVTNAVGPIVSNTQPLNIGWYSFYNWFTDGRIDEVRIYNRVLTDQEISFIGVI